MSGLRVLIVGASIAGPTAAYWFAKAGASVTVIERWPQLREGGHNIDLRTTGLTVMRKMPGMEDAVKAKKVVVDGISFVNDSGAPIATIHPTGDPDQQSLISEYEIFRGDLSRIIYDMTKNNAAIKYVFGEQITALRQNDNNGPITVDFMNGYPSGEYDLVVACDGSTSRTRALGLNCGVRTHIQTTNTWAGYFTMPGDLLNGSKMATTWNQVHGRCCFMLSDPAAKKTRVGLMSVDPQDKISASAAFREAAKQDIDTLKGSFLDRFASTSWRMPEVLEGLKEAKDFYATEIVQVKVPTLYQGRFVLVGDAGYATGLTGAGTSLAMAGAYLLAGEINKHGNDIAAGLKEYEVRMKPIIADMQQIPPGISSILAPQTAIGLWFRNLVLVIVAFVARFQVLGRMFSWVGGWYAAAFGKDKYGLPDYEWKK